MTTLIVGRNTCVTSQQSLNIVTVNQLTLVPEHIMNKNQSGPKSASKHPTESLILEHVGKRKADGV